MVRRTLDEYLGRARQCLLILYEQADGCLPEQSAVKVLKNSDEWQREVASIMVYVGIRECVSCPQQLHALLELIALIVTYVGGVQYLRVNRSVN